MKERLNLKTENVKAATIQQLQQLQWQAGVGLSDFDTTSETGEPTHEDEAI